jgi:hypothetical protein
VVALALFLAGFVAWLVALARFVTLSGFVPLALLIALALVGLRGFGSRFRAGDLLGSRFRRVRHDTGAERGSRFALALTMFAVLALPVFAVLSLAVFTGFLSVFTRFLAMLASFLTMVALLGLARFMLAGGLGLGLIALAELRCGFEAFANRLVGDFRLPGNLLRVFADLRLSLRKSLLGIVKCMGRGLLSRSRRLAAVLASRLRVGRLTGRGLIGGRIGGGLGGGIGEFCSIRDDVVSRFLLRLRVGGDLLR